MPHFWPGSLLPPPKTTHGPETEQQPAASPAPATSLRPCRRPLRLPSHLRPGARKASPGTQAEPRVGSNGASAVRSSPTPPRARTTRPQNLPSTLGQACGHGLREAQVGAASSGALCGRECDSTWRSASVLTGQHPQPGSVFPGCHVSIQQASTSVTPEIHPEALSPQGPGKKPRPSSSLPGS